MSIGSLDKVINPNLLTKISKVSGQSSASSTSASKELTGQALYDSLRSGAQNFAAGMQLLNGSATFVNLSLDTTEKLLDLVKKLEEISAKANRGNISGAAAKQMRVDFEKLAQEFDKKIESAKRDNTDLLDVEQLRGVLANSGLEAEKISELAKSLKRFAHPADPTLSEDGTLTSEGNPVPLADFQRLLRAAIVDPDDLSDDRSGFFSRIKNDLKDLRIKLEANVTALKDTARLIGENIKLVRSTGLAFLGVSKEMTGLESAEALVSKIREEVSRTARTSLAQAHNLEPIMVAGLAALSEKQD
jgi:hypothetical protein